MLIVGPPPEEAPGEFAEAEAVVEPAEALEPAANDPDAEARRQRWQDRLKFWQGN